MTDPLLRLPRALRELDAALQAAHVGPLLKAVIAGVEVWDE